jgi:predicted permease
VSSNIKSALRFIRKRPSFSVAVVLTLGLGTGVNTAVFTAVNAILLRPLPFPNSDRLMLLQQYERDGKRPPTFVAPARLEDWDQLNNTFAAITGYYTQDVSETSGSVPEKLTEALVAPRFLQVWGIAPALGRDFSPAEEHFGGPNAALITDRLWRRRFNADPRAVGKRLRIEKSSMSIVGVMPPSFLFPDHDVDVWTPSQADSPYAQSRQSTWFIVTGRLRPGVTAQQARENLNAIQKQLGLKYGKPDSDLAVRVQALKDTTIGAVQRSLWVMFGSVCLLLVIACVNVSALLLARTTERRREIAVRFSLGATRVPIIKQLLTECLVLAVAGSVLGIAIAAIASRWLRTLSSALPRTEEIRLDWHVLLYTAVCSIIVTLMCGSIPAFRATRHAIADDLSSGGRTQVSGRNPLQSVLVGVQVAMAVTLLTGAGLLLRTFQELGRVSPGFDAHDVLTLRVSGNWGETANMPKLRQRMQRTLEELRATPGVRGAALAATLPGIPSDSRSDMSIVEGQRDPDEKVSADNRYVSDGYFNTMRIPFLGGEDCRDVNGKFDEVVINKSFANAYLNNIAAVGRHITLTAAFYSSTARIVGVVGDAREQGINRDPVPTVYWCVLAPTPSPNFLLRTEGNPMLMADSVRRLLRRVEPARSVYDISPLQAHLADNFAETRLRTLVLTFFALAAVSLACVGLYGTISYFVAIRRREVGLRLALGALRWQIVSKFLLHGIYVSAIGCAAGLSLALLTSKALAGMLYGVSRADPETLIGVVVLSVTIAAAASALPAIRAAAVEPVEVLREE